MYKNKATVLEKATKDPKNSNKQCTYITETRSYRFEKNCKISFKNNTQVKWEQTSRRRKWMRENKINKNISVPK